MFPPRSERTTALTVSAVLMKLMFLNVMPLVLLVPTLKGADGFATVTSFADQSETDVAVAPTIVTVAVPRTVMASVYVPGWTETVAIPLFCATLMAALMAVYCPEPSVATVMIEAEVEDVEEGAVESIVELETALEVEMPLLRVGTVAEG